MTTEAKPRSLAGAAGMAGLATMLSRITGLVREQAVAWIFGAGAATDMYNVAFRIPNLLRDLVAENALNSAFVPAFTTALEGDKQIPGDVEAAGKPRAFALLNRVVGTVGAAILAVTLLGYLFTPQIVWMMASGFEDSPGKTATTVLMTRIMLPFLLMISMAALAMGVLNTFRWMFLPAFAPVMFNMGNIVVGAGLALAAPRLGIDPIVGMAIGTMAGGVGQLAIQVPALWREGYTIRPEIAPRDPGVRAVAAMMAPAVLSVAALNINVMVSTQIGSWLREGSISWLNFAYRLFQLPIGIFGVSLASVLVPELKRRLLDNDAAGAAEQMNEALRLVIALCLPVTVATIVMARPLVSLIYEYRKFSATSTDETAAALVSYSVGLLGFTLVKVVAPAFYSLKEPWIPARASLVSIALNVVFSFALMKPLGHCGLALAVALNGLVNAAILIAGLRGRIAVAHGELIGFSVKVGVASLVMGAAIHGAQGALDGWLGHAHVMPRAAIVAGGAAAGGIVLIAVLKALRVPEADRLVGLVTRRFRRS